MKKDLVPSSVTKAEVTPEELEEGAMLQIYELEFSKPENWHMERIRAGWKYLDKEVKELTLAAYPDVAKSLLRNLLKSRIAKEKVNRFPHPPFGIKRTC